MTPAALAGIADRWALFAAMLVVTGTAAFRFFVLPRLPDGVARGSAVVRRAAMFGAWAALVVFVAALGRLPLQLTELADPGAPLMPQARALVLHTSWGSAWLAQLALALLAWAAFVVARGGRTGAWAIAALLAAGLAFTPAFSGHAVGSERFPTLAIIADGLHVLGAGQWLGAMLLLFAALRAGAGANDGGERARALVAGFSRLALVSATLVLATGLIGAWLHLTAVSDLWQSRYGSMLFRKLMAVALLALTGLYNWRRAGPALQKTGQIGPMTRSVGAELVVGVLVLLATAILVVTPPPGME